MKIDKIFLTALATQAATKVVRTNFSGNSSVYSLIRESSALLHKVTNDETCEHVNSLVLLLKCPPSGLPSSVFHQRHLVDCSAYNKPLLLVSFHSSWHPSSYSETRVVLATLPRFLFMSGPPDPGPRAKPLPGVLILRSLKSLSASSTIERKRSRTTSPSN